MGITINKVIRYFMALAISTLWHFSYLSPANIIFDLGGVLMETSKLKTVSHSGLLTLPLYALRTMQNPRTKLFDILDTIDPITRTWIKPYDELGNPLPDIMCDWLKGVPSSIILSRIQTVIDKSHPLWALSQAIFDPEQMAKTQYIISAGKKFVEECIEQGHCLYILSNWDPESFALLRQRFPDFFGLFSGIIISGDCGILKPDPAIYQYLLKEFSLDPKTCFFIDNQQENVVAANCAGIHGYLVKKNWSGRPHFKKVGKVLTHWLATQENNSEIVESY